MARVSRRKLVAGMSAAPWLTDGRLAAPAAADPVLVLCAHYADLMRHGDTLLRRWSAREDWLATHRDWFNLSDAAQKRLPEAQLLALIDAEYERCTREGAQVLRRLRKMPALTIEGATAKVRVAADAIDPDDYPSAHRVLLSAIADLRALQTRT